MADFMANYPLVVASCLFCILPGGLLAVGVSIGRAVERRGGWPRLSWPVASMGEGDSDDDE